MRLLVLFSYRLFKAPPVSPLVVCIYFPMFILTEILRPLPDEAGTFVADAVAEAGVEVINGCFLMSYLLAI